MGHTLPFLLPQLGAALTLAYIVVVIEVVVTELLAIAYIRFQFMRTPLGRTIVQVI